MGKPQKTFELRLRSFRARDIDKEFQEEASKSVHWRKQMKRDPKRYDAYKKYDALRAELKRQELKEKLNQPGNEELRAEHRAKKARKMREYRAKKKLQKQEDEKKNGRRLKTRAEEEKENKKKAKDAARKRKERAKIPKKKRKQINAKRRQKRQEEKELLLELQLQGKLRLEKEMERLQKEQIRLEEEWAKLEAAKSQPRSATAKRKSLERSRKVISKEPIVYADTVEDLVAKASPRKKKLLQEKGIGSKLSISDIDKIIADGVREKVTSLCKSRKKKDLKLKRELAPALAVAKKYRSQRSVCKALKITPKMITYQVHVGRPHKGRVSERTTSLVEDFYIEHSITLPDKKLVSKKTNQPARFLTMTIQSLHAKFIKVHTTVQLGLSKFSSMRPQHIKLRSALKYRGCLCEYCANVELKIQSINQLCHQNRLPSAYSSVYDMNKSTLCPRDPDNRYHKLKCIDRQCAECGVGSITTQLQPLSTKIGNQQITWKKWVRVEFTQENGNKGKRMALKPQEGKLTQLIDELKTETKTLSLHLFNALWQGNRFSEISNNPPEGCVVMVLDFAENYACRYQDEIQSVHWGHASATIHPIVAYYKCPTCASPTTDSLIMITDDNSHDHHAVHHFTGIAVDHLKQKLPNLTKIVRFSDGCQAQYKSRGPFMDVSYGQHDYGVKYQHEFFGSRHGKGPSDGESGVIKRQATDGVMSGNAIITNAYELYLYIKKHSTRPQPNERDTNACFHFQRTVFYVQDIDRDRPDRQTSHTVKDTRLFHHALSVSPNVIAVRKLSCFCEQCLQNEGTCSNAQYIQPYIFKDVLTGKTVNQVAKPNRRQRPTTASQSVRQTPVQEQGATTSGESLNQETSEKQRPNSPSETERQTPVQEQGVMTTGESLNQETSKTQGPISPSERQTPVQQQGVMTTGESLNQETRHITSGDFVAVKFSPGSRKNTEQIPVVYMAAVLDVDGENLVLNFMELKTATPFMSYFWPEVQKHYTHPMEDAVCIVNPPEVAVTRRETFYHFSDADILKVKESFNRRVTFK